MFKIHWDYTDEEGAKVNISQEHDNIAKNELGGRGEKTNQDGLDHFPRSRLQVDAKSPGPETCMANLWSILVSPIYKQCKWSGLIPKEHQAHKRGEIQRIKGVFT